MLKGCCDLAFFLAINIRQNNETSHFQLISEALFPFSVYLQNPLPLQSFQHNFLL